MTSVQRAEEILRKVHRRVAGYRRAARINAEDRYQIDLLDTPFEDEVDFLDFVPTARDLQLLNDPLQGPVPYSFEPPINTTAPWDLPSVVEDAPDLELLIPELVALLGPEAVASTPWLIPLLPEIALSLAAAGVLYGSFKAGQALGRRFKTRPGRVEVTSSSASSSYTTRAGASAQSSETYFGPNHGNTVGR